MNPDFEQKVNNSLDVKYPTAVNTVGLNNISASAAQRKKLDKRLLLIPFVLIIVCFALILILRGFFLQNPPEFNNDSILDTIGRVFDTNPATKLNSLTLTQAETIINNFTDTLTEEFQPIPNNDFRYLQLEAGPNTTISKFNKDETLQQIAFINSPIEIFRFYNENTFLYAINSPNSHTSELYLNTRNNPPILIRKLGRDEVFISAHFSIQDKTFYYSYFDRNNTVHIEATDVKGRDYNLYQTNFLNTQASVWYVGASEGTIYLNQQKECYTLGLRDKVISPFACEKIRSNLGGNFYWTNESTDGLYKAYQNGEIYKFTFGEAERKVILSKGNGQVVNRLSLSGNNLYYVLNNLTSAAPTLWNTTAVDIRYVNTVTTAETTLNLKNIRSDIHTIIPFDNLYATSLEFFGKSYLYRYNPDPELPVVAPASFPSSFPAKQEPTQEELAEYYWEKVDLGIAYERVKVILPRYSFDF